MSVAFEPVVSEAVESGSGPVVGVRTTRIYCRENCPPGRRTKPENRVYFESEVAATAAGYRPCKVCRPDVFSGAWAPKVARS